MDLVSILLSIKVIVFKYRPANEDRNFPDIND